MIESAARSSPTGVEPIVSSLARTLAGSRALNSGDLARLRRMDPRLPEAAFYKLEGLVLDDCLPGEAAARADLETRWAAVIVGLAELADLHRPGERFGYALGKAQLSEVRFVRLVRANAEQLLDELPSLARFLRAKGVAADWSGAASLILTAGKHGEADVRRHIARDYYGLVARAEND